MRGWYTCTGYVLTVETIGAEWKRHLTTRQLMAAMEIKTSIITVLPYFMNSARCIYGLLQCYIWPVVLYGCEAWTLVEDLRKKIEAFEMWTYRRMLRISWTAKVSNAEVLARMQKKTELVKTIKQRKISYLGHILRHNRYRLLQTIMMGKIAGKRGGVKKAPRENAKSKY
ncbi:uncharacterized protein [Maniola hyperantus]|uniref:uncharacterized protein n=1 Tax=Aphantopus hyperantus TaxID=2795564 RepID=UPI00374A508A